MSDSEEQESKRLKTDVDRYTACYDESVFKNELILNHIFKNLTAKELRSIGRVCKTWLNLSTKLSRQYSSTEDLFLIYGLTNYMRTHNERYSKLITLNDVTNYDGLKTEILHSFKHRLQSIPSVALFFNTFRGLSQKHYTSFLNSSKLLDLLPRSCSVMSVSVCDTGVIGNDNQIGPVETMQDHKFISGISYLFLPDLTVHGCQIIPFKGCQSELCRYLNEEQIIERNIKGVITFLKFDTSSSPDLSILREILGIQRNKVALGGIMVEQIDVSSNVDCKMSRSDASKSMIKTDFSALMFCGENVNCASLIINATEVPQLKSRLAEFRNNLHFNPDQPDSELFGFLFACAGRGFNIFNKLNLESDIIKEQFPNLKLYGIFGLGEVGINHFGNYRSNKIRKDTVLHYYTTVLFIAIIPRSKHVTHPVHQS